MLVRVMDNVLVALVPVSVASTAMIVRLEHVHPFALATDSGTPVQTLVTYTVQLQTTRAATTTLAANATKDGKAPGAK